MSQTINKYRKCSAKQMGFLIYSIKQHEKKEREKNSADHNTTRWSEDHHVTARSQLMIMWIDSRDSGFASLFFVHTQKKRRNKNISNCWNAKTIFQLCISTRVGLFLVDVCGGKKQTAEATREERITFFGRKFVFCFVYERKKKSLRCYKIGKVLRGEEVSRGVWGIFKF